MAIKLWQDSYRMVVMSGHDRPSTNRKTGPMAQTWIMPLASSPTEAVKTGKDALVCGDCPLRGDGAGGERLCYLNLGKGPNGIYRSVVDKDVEDLPNHPFGVRLGAWGDPVYLPRTLLKKVVKGKSHVGYTHQWMKKSAQWLRPYCMASVDDLMAKKVGMNVKDLARHAWGMGWRTFRITHAPGENWDKKEVDCPHLTHGVQCKDCGLCKGASEALSISNPIHGRGAKWYPYQATAIGNTSTKPASSTTTG